MAGFQGVEVEENRQIPIEKNGLAINAKPNPFNTSITITYQLAKPAKVECRIFDASGREIKTLVSSQADKGLHRIIWNGKDNNNERVNAGVYFLRIITEQEQTQTKLIML